MRHALLPMFFVLLIAGLWAGVSLAGPPLPAADVFEAVAQKKTARARSQYLKAHAGAVVAGAGRLEALSPRSFYDTSVPDSDPMVALVELEAGKKAACGLPRSVMDSLGWLREGSPVAFEGRLVDAQPWGNSTTLYLTGCTLTRR